MSASSEPVETARSAVRSDAARSDAVCPGDGDQTLVGRDGEFVDSHQIHQRVADFAAAAGDRSEFLKLLAAELLAHFDSSIVAVQASHWPSPMMLVADDPLSEQIRRPAVRELLASASMIPIACNVPVIATAGESSTTRGLRIELVGVPERAAVLLVYATHQVPDAVVQIEDLRQLRLFAEATRSVLWQVPITDRQPPPSDRIGNSAEQENQISTTTSLSQQRSLSLFHRDLDLEATCYRIANESRRMIGCDRTTVLVPRASRLRAIAVSGVSVVDSRSNAIRAAERMTRAAAVMARPLVLPGSEPLPPQLQEPLDEYLDESGVMSAMFLPLHAPSSDDNVADDNLALDPFSVDGDLIGVMLLEYFVGTAPRELTSGMTLVAGEATLALSNALEHKKIFGLRLWKTLGGLMHRSALPWVAASVTLSCGLLFAALTVPVEHHVVASGTLEPAVRRDVFAAVDGVVKTLHVSDGQQVRAGDLLIELENAELESRAESLAGEIQTTTKRLAALQAVRLSPDGDAAASARMAMDQRQLESELANLKAQAEILRHQQQQLRITSPIDATVIGWQLQGRLANRPVSRGNLLISLVDRQGPWSLRLNLPDRTAGALLQAAESDPRRRIEFAVATQPESSFAATLQSIATAAHLDQSGQHIIEALAIVTGADSDADNADQVHNGSVDHFDRASMRVGADVRAKIFCGQRSLLHSWFSDVFDFVHRNVLFYF